MHTNFTPFGIVQVPQSDFIFHSHQASISIFVVSPFQKICNHKGLT